MAAPQKNQTLVGTILADRYRVEREIGKGAMGRVYEAHHTTIGRRLAIKVLNRSYGTSLAQERFFHEARAAGAISHQHIVPVLDFGLIETGEPYIVMEYVDGETLESYITREAPTRVADAVEICAQVLSALEVIHGAGLVHRDIKPANIMLVKVRRPRFHCQLLDFGVARALHAAWHRPDLTRVHEVLGTPAYFSPEQACGGPVEPRGDLWAVGAVLYELLTGTLPFDLKRIEQVIADLVNRRLVPLRRRNGALPEWIYQVVERAHHEDPEQRFGTATLFLQALEQNSAHPEGEGETGVRTTLFVRVDLQTPPPELVGQLAQPASRQLTQRDAVPSASPFESQLTNPDLPSHRQQQGWPEGPGSFDEEAPTGSGARRGRTAVAEEEGERPWQEEDRTIPIQRLGAEDLGRFGLDELDDDHKPLPKTAARLTEVVGPQPPARRRGGQTWITVALALLILVAAGCIVYFGLLLS